MIQFLRHSISLFIFLTLSIKLSSSYRILFLFAVVHQGLSK